MENKNLKLVKQFLATFYFQQFSFTDANLSSMEYLEKFPDYEEELSDAFYYIFESDDPEINFYDLAKNYANRHREDEASAREIISEIFKRNVLDLRVEEPVMSALRPTRV